MKTRITFADLNEIIYEKPYLLSSDAGEGIYQNSIYGDYSFGQIEMHEIKFDGVYINFGNLQLSQDTVLDIEADYPIVEMHFNLSGNSNSQCHDQSFSVAFNSNQHNITFYPHFKGKFESSGAGNLKILEIGLSILFFHRLAQNNNVLMEKMLEHIRNERMASYFRHNMPITPQMQMIINDIMFCNRGGYFKRLFLESKIIELFLLQLEQFETEDCKVFCTLKKHDVDKIYEAKSILESQVDAPFTLLSLSRLVGLNDFKLKRGFKELFGNTVFGYLNELKMQRARELLLTSELSVAEVATITGYKNQTHFTAAFKRKFGVLPRELK